MRVDLVHLNSPPVEGKRTHNNEKSQEFAAANSLEFTKVLETMLKELGELKKEEGRRSDEARQDLGQFIRSVEKADEKYKTAMFLRKTLIEAYRNISQGQVE